jgi:hypothetical protein
MFMQWEEVSAEGLPDSKCCLCKEVLCPRNVDVDHRSEVAV